jgi:ornithine carbamoyltransferase
VARLGGLPQVVGPEDLHLGRRETIEDTARVVSRYARAFVIRTYADEDVSRAALAATIPVVKALTERHHPCQALADLMTLRDHFGRLAGLRVAYVGAGNNVAHSLLEACALAGVDLAVATPPGYAPRGHRAHRAQALGAERQRGPRRVRRGERRPRRGCGLHGRVAVQGRQRRRAGGPSGGVAAVPGR